MLQRMSRVNLTRFSNELLPVHSPLLRQSRLISFPLLINMLKFSKYSNLTSAWKCRLMLRVCVKHHAHMFLFLHVTNTDMIKISRVMTVAQWFVYVYNSVSTYNIASRAMKYCYISIASSTLFSSNLPAIHLYESNEFDVLLTRLKQI